MNIIQATRDLLRRHRQRLRAIAIRGAAQAIGTVAPLVVLASHGSSALGLFSVLLAVAGLSVLFEWGLPLTLQNEVSRGASEQRYDLRWLLLRSGALPHLALNLLLAAGLWLLATSLLDRLFPPAVAGVLGGHEDALLAMFVIAAITGSLYHGHSIVFGLGHIDRGFACTLLAALTTLSLVVLGVATGVPTSLLAVAVAATPLLDRLFACAYCFSRRGGLARHPSIPPPLDTAGSARNRRSVALMFLYLQLLALLASNLDSIYAARSNSLQAVGEYAFLVKLFGIPLLVANILNTASMPRLAVESHSHADGGRGTVLTLLRSSAGIVGGTGLLILLGGGPLYHFISGSSAELRPLAALMLVDACLLAVRSVMTTYTNAAEVMWLNIVGNTAFAAAAIALKVVLVESHGVQGLVVANIAAYVLCLLPFQLFALLRGTRR